MAVRRQPHTRAKRPSGAPVGKIWLQCHVCKGWFLRKKSEHEKCRRRGRKHSYCSVECTKANPMRSAPKEMVGAHVEDIVVRRALASTYRKARLSAEKRGIPFKLTRRQFDAIERRAAGRCEVSGIPFRNTDGPRNARRPFMPSLDRIDSSRPYTAANCRLVCVAVNLGMNGWGAQVLEEIALGIVTRLVNDGDARVPGIRRRRPSTATPRRKRQASP